MSLPDKPWFLVAKFFPSEQIQVVNSVWVRYNIIPVSTEEPNFDAFVEENLSEFFHGSLNSNVVIDVCASGPSFINFIDMIGSFVHVHVINHSIIYVAFGDLRE